MHLQATACIQSTHFLHKNSCLLGDKYKFIANVRDKDYKISKIDHFVA